MDDAIAVYVCNCFKEIAQYFNNLVFLELSSFSDLFEEMVPRTIFHN